jgi:hypothetical protein
MHHLLHPPLPLPLHLHPLLLPLLHLAPPPLLAVPLPHLLPLLQHLPHLLHPHHPHHSPPSWPFLRPHFLSKNMKKCRPTTILVWFSRLSLRCHVTVTKH